MSFVKDVSFSTCWFYIGRKVYNYTNMQKSILNGFFFNQIQSSMSNFLKILTSKTCNKCRKNEILFPCYKQNIFKLLRYTIISRNTPSVLFDHVIDNPCLCLYNCMTSDHDLYHQDELNRWWAFKSKLHLDKISNLLMNVLNRESQIIYNNFIFILINRSFIVTVPFLKTPSFILTRKRFLYKGVQLDKLKDTTYQFGKHLLIRFRYCH